MILLLTRLAAVLAAFRAWILGLACRHPDDAIRCVPGDEIHWRGGARAVCMLCNTSLSRELPRICTVTGRPHGEPDALR